MIGAGWMGNAIAGDFALCEGVELRALGSRRLDAGRAWAHERGIPVVVSTEELVAREHELRSLTASGAPPWRWAVRALCIADSALVVAQNDLSSKPAAERTPAHAAESR